MSWKRVKKGGLLAAEYAGYVCIAFGAAALLYLCALGSCEAFGGGVAENPILSAKEIAEDAHKDCVCPHCKATWVFYDKALKVLSREHALRMDGLEARIKTLEDQ